MPVESMPFCRVLGHITDQVPAALNLIFLGLLQVEGCLETLIKTTQPVNKKSEAIGVYE